MRVEYQILQNTIVARIWAADGDVTPTEKVIVDFMRPILTNEWHLCVLVSIESMEVFGPVEAYVVFSETPPIPVMPPGRSAPTADSPSIPLQPPA